jgi:hypothetical protein
MDLFKLKLLVHDVHTYACVYKLIHSFMARAYRAAVGGEGHSEVSVK